MDKKFSPQILKKIPKGDYCYDLLSVVRSRKYGFVLKTKCCPFLKKHPKEKDPLLSWCKLKNYEVWDDCKVCGLKEEF